MWGVASSLSMSRTYRGVKSVTIRKAVGNLEIPYGCEITVMVQEGLRNCYTHKVYKLMKVIVQEGLKACILVQEGLKIVMLSNYKYVKLI